MKSKIKYTHLIPPDVKPLPDAVDAILNADLIVLGPGSLYTSIIPNLLVDGISQAIFSSDATTVYVCNIMTQPYETVGYTAYDHYRAIIDHSFENILDFCIINSQQITNSLLEKYNAEGSEPVIIDRERFKSCPTILIEDELISVKDGFIRHDTNKLAKILINIGSIHKKKRDKISTKDKIIAKSLNIFN